MTYACDDVSVKAIMLWSETDFLECGGGDAAERSLYQCRGFGAFLGVCVLVVGVGVVVCGEWWL